MALTVAAAHTRSNTNFTIMLVYQFQIEKLQQAVKFEHLAVVLIWWNALERVIWSVNLTSNLFSIQLLKIVLQSISTALSLRHRSFAHLLIWH